MKNTILTTALGSRAFETAAGTFLPQVTYATGNDPRSVATGDLNHDGVADVAVANFGDNTLSLINGVGDGTLGAATTMATGNGPIFVSLLDADDSGSSSITFLNNLDNTMTIIPKDVNTGLAEPAVTYSTGVGPKAMIYTYLHYQESDEPAVVNSDGTVSIFQSQDSDGNYMPAQVTYNVTPGATAAWITLTSLSPLVTSTTTA